MTNTFLSTFPNLKLVRYFEPALISQVSYVYHNVFIILSKFYCTEIQTFLQVQKQ